MSCLTNASWLNHQSKSNNCQRACVFTIKTVILPFTPINDKGVAGQAKWLFFEGRDSEEFWSKGHLWCFTVLRNLLCFTSCCQDKYPSAFCTKRFIAAANLWFKLQNFYDPLFSIVSYQIGVCVCPLLLNSESQLSHGSVDMAFMTVEIRRGYL